MRTPPLRPLRNLCALCGKSVSNPAGIGRARFFRRHSARTPDHIASAMSLRRWIREQVLGADAEGNDLPPGGSLMNTALGRDPLPKRSLGEYTAHNYPTDLAEILRCRSAVTAALLRMDVTDPAARAQAIPRLKELLREYPHPLAYETLIHAYLETGRYDEARGVAFAARERRHECQRSPHPEIRAEIDRLREWNPQDVDTLRAEIESRPRR